MFNIENHREIVEVQTVQDPALGIMKWGRVNAFPQTLINIINQSPLAKPAVERTTKFYIGNGFEQEDFSISKLGLTLGDLYKTNSLDFSYFRALAIHVNYNMKAEITSAIPMRVADLRFKEFDELNYSSKLGYHSNFGLNSEIVKTISDHPANGKIKWFDRFNPDPEIVKEQIAKAGGIKKYNGQILYFSETGHSSYPIPQLQPPINFVLADVENSILVRKETSTGFINTYLLKTSLPSDDENLIELEGSIVQSQGARGSGKVITFAGLPAEDVNSTILEEVGGRGTAKAIIDSATATYELCEKVINGAYLIPPILAGADQNTGFSSEDLKDAYFVFNAITQGGRSIIEKQINRVMKHFKGYDEGPVKVSKLKLDVEQVNEATVEPQIGENV